MSLFTLDFLVTKEGNIKLAEINGIRSHIGRFNEIYPHKNLVSKAKLMLENRHGDIFFDSFYYDRKLFEEKWKKRSALSKAKIKIAKLLTDNTSPILSTKKAFVEWRIPTKIHVEKPKNYYNLMGFPMYDGQDDVTVFNYTKPIFDRPSGLKHVQDPVIEEITNNKFYQYMLLKDSNFKEYIPKTVLVGLGITKNEELWSLLTENEQVIRKPLSSGGANGVEVIHRDTIGEEFSRYSKSSLKEKRAIDLIKDVKLMKQSLKGEDHLRNYIIENLGDLATDIKDYIALEQYEHVELGLAILQEFIDTRNHDGEYTAVRSFVVNEKFLGSYLRVDKEPIVNIPKGARTYSYDNNKIGELSEGIVSTLLQKRSELRENYQEEIYRNYFGDLYSDLTPKNIFNANSLAAATQAFFLK